MGTMHFMLGDSLYKWTHTCSACLATWFAYPVGWTSTSKESLRHLYNVQSHANSRIISRDFHIVWVSPDMSYQHLRPDLLCIITVFILSIWMPPLLMVATRNNLVANLINKSLVYTIWQYFKETLTFHRRGYPDLSSSACEKTPHSSMRRNISAFGFRGCGSRSGFVLMISTHAHLTFLLWDNHLIER